MPNAAWASVAAIVLGLAGSGCRRAYVRTVDVAPAPASGGGVTVLQAQPQASPGYDVSGSVQLLYLPVEASQLPLHLIQAVYVQTDDGRQFQITRADVVAGMGGRIALRIPAGVTTGTATLVLTNGQQWTSTFHIAASSAGVSIGAGAPQAAGVIGDPRCQLPSGTWQGTISDDPRSRSTVWLEVLGDCRTVRGYVHLDSASGSVDSTIEGLWDPYSSTIVARDMQLFNVQPLPGGGFCPTDEYRLQVSPDGRSIQGQNIIYQAPCQGASRVWLVR